MTSTTLDETRWHIPWHLVSLAGGLALAALLAISQSDLSGAEAPATRSSVTRVSESRANVSPVLEVVTFYIARDEDQLIRVREKYDEAFLTESLPLSEYAPNRFNVFIVTTPEAEARAWALIDESMAAANFTGSSPAPRFEIIDLR